MVTEKIEIWEADWGTYFESEHGTACVTRSNVGSHRVCTVLYTACASLLYDDIVRRPIRIMFPESWQK